jgi:hypothetical protein
MKNKLNIMETPLTPKVFFDSEQNILEITGRAIPMSPEKFWGPVMSWFIRHSYNNQEMKISFNFDYLNSGSQRFILKLLNLLRESSEKGMTSDRTIYWNYQDYDQDMFEIGQDLEYVSRVKLEYVELTEESFIAA